MSGWSVCIGGSQCYCKHAMIYSIGMNKKIGPTQPVLISIFGMFDFIMENNKTSLLHTQDTKVGLDYLH